MLFNDTSVRTCSVSCITIHSKFAITRPDNQATHKVGCQLVIACGHFNLPRGFVDIYGLTFSLYHPRGTPIWDLYLHGKEQGNILPPISHLSPEKPSQQIHM